MIIVNTEFEDAVSVTFAGGGGPIPPVVDLSGPASTTRPGVFPGSYVAIVEYEFSSGCPSVPITVTAGATATLSISDSSCD